MSLVNESKWYRRIAFPCDSLETRDLGSRTPAGGAGPPDSSCPFIAAEVHLFVATLPGREGRFSNRCPRRSMNLNIDPGP